MRGIIINSMQFDSKNLLDKENIKKLIKRHFFSTGRCSSGCKYCFAHQPDYQKFEDFSNQAYERMTSTYNIVYPSCDGEFFNNPNTINQLDLMRKNVLGKNIIFSITTKAILDEEEIKEISRINKEMIEQNKGFIKVSVTISNQSMIQEIEPNTSNFFERIDTLEMLRKYDIPSSVILKPLLPFIDIQEYIDIIRTTLKYTDLYLIGELYININSDFYKKYIKKDYHVDLKTVEWLDNKKMYRVIETTEMQHRIKDWIIGLYSVKGIKPNIFENDTELLLYIKNRIDTRNLTKDNLQIFNTI